jgi:hypothetical protein
MNAAIKRLLRKEIASLAIASFGLTFASAQPQRDSDLIAQARQARELATQEAEASVRKALNKSKTLGDAEGLALLRQTLAAIDGNSGLDESRKTAMVQALRSAIQSTEYAMKSRGERTDGAASAEKRDRDAVRRADVEKQEQERLKVKEEIRKIDSLIGQGRTQEAERKAKELATQFPENPAARIMGQRSFINSRIRDARELLAQQEKNTALALQPDKGPPKDDIEVDKKRWKEIAKSPFRGVGPPLSEKEKTILTALSKTIHPEWQNVKFDNAIDELQKLIGVPLAIDRKALEDASIGTDSMVNFSLPQAVTTRTVLRKILADKGLGYVIRDETIFITTLNNARDMMTTRSYPIGDLVTPIGTQLPGMASQQEDTIVKYIIDTIKRSVDPMSWQGEGGKATISYDPINKALIIRQSAEVHLSMRNSFAH